MGNETRQMTRLEPCD